MATFVFIHGAGGRGSYWDLVAEHLHAAGHDTVAVDLPCDDDAAGWSEYADSVVEAVGDRRGDLVLVAQSLGGFTAPLVADRVPVELIVLVTAMVPRPGETGGEWWANTRLADARAEQGLPEDADLFVHDVPPDVLAAAGEPRGQSGTPMDQPFPLDHWPAVATRFLLCMDDRFFPPDWMREVVRDRLAIEPVEIPGGHCAFLSQPKALAAALLDAWDERTSLEAG
jgi:pimeloyl-ACP methyl ester carboxylesterase